MRLARMTSQKAAHGFLLRLLALLALVVSRRSGSEGAWRDALGNLGGVSRSQWAAVRLDLIKRQPPLPDRRV